MDIEIIFWSIVDYEKMKLNYNKNLQLNSSAPTILLFESRVAQHLRSYRFTYIVKINKINKKYLNVIVLWKRQI